MMILRALRFPRFASSKAPTVKQVQATWDQFSHNYNKFDYCPQTLYYSLLYMLNVWQAKSILEVGCGTGKLLHMAASMKNSNASYLATDLSPKMIELTHTNLKSNLSLYDSKLTLEQWMKRNKFAIQCANAEEPIPVPANFSKFDRIISNCVLMLTSDPQKMLLNLHNQAAQGCLLGVSVWGNKHHNNLMTAIRETYIQSKVQLPEERSNFHLYKKVPDLAAKCGWEVVLSWQQNALFPALSADSQKYESFFFHQIQKIQPSKQEEAKKILLKKVDNYFKQDKKGLNFSCQMLILRKK